MVLARAFGIITIIRMCWIWPWLGLVQRGFAAEEPVAALSVWAVLLLPLISFMLARQIMMVPAGGMGQDAAADNSPPLPIGPRLALGVAGICAAVMMVWFQKYSSGFGVWNPAWIGAMGDRLIHWPQGRIAVPAEVVVIVSGLGLWLVGLLDAGRMLTHDRIWRTFAVGVAMLSVVLLNSSVVDPVGLTTGRTRVLLTLVVVMVTAGMAALAFSSIKVTAGLDRVLGFGVRQIDGDAASGAVGSKIGRATGETTPVVNRYWLLSVGGVIGLLLLLGCGLMVLIAPEVLQAVLDGLWAVASFVGTWAARLLMLVVYAAGLIFFFVYRLLGSLLQALFGDMELESDLLDNMAQQPQEEHEDISTLENAPLPDEYRWLGLAILGLISLVVFALVIRRLSRTQVETLDEERESILSADLLQDQLGRLWDRLASRFRRGDGPERFLPLEGEATRQRIRAVYQQLLATAGELGEPRRPGLTPVAYADRLRQSGELRVDGEAEALRRFYGAQWGGAVGCDYGGLCGGKVWGCGTVGRERGWGRGCVGGNRGRVGGSVSENVRGTRRAWVLLWLYWCRVLCTGTVDA